jgi:hypothetical protein
VTISAVGVSTLPTGGSTNFDKRDQDLILKVSTATWKIETPDRKVPAHDKEIPLPPTD